MTLWQTWTRRPRQLWLRRALFQVHLWTGIVLGIYLIVICLSGSVLVYRNELYRAFQPLPGQPTSLGYRVTAWLLYLHADLHGGDTGRRVNGFGAAAVILLAVTGMVVWWPGIQRWRRSLVVDVGANWKQLTWSLHSAAGAWFVAFVLMWGVTGLYLSYPQPFNAAVDYLEPFDDGAPTAERVGDRVLYWLAYAHFGRFGGRVAGCGRGTCDEIFKAVWAVFGLAPVVMTVTGVAMWWNRTKRRAAIRSGDGSVV